MATIFRPDQEDDKKRTLGARSGFQTVGSAAPGTQTTSPQQTQPAGSGRFTNLQKYLQANQASGQRMAGQIGQGIQSGLQKQQEKTTGTLGVLGQNIEEAKLTAEAGKGYQQDLAKIGENIKSAGIAPRETPITDLSQMTPEEMQKFQAWQQGTQNLGIEDFINSDDPSKFRQFQAIQSGRGIDESLLGLRQQQAAQQAGELLSSAQQARQALGTEGGRFDLLRKTFGGQMRPGYTTGQQRLDQALLSRAGLGNLVGDVQGKIAEARGLAGQAAQKGTEVSGIASQERGLMQNIAKQAGLNEQEFINMIGSFKDPFNIQREQEQKRIEDAFKYQQELEKKQQDYITESLKSSGPYSGYLKMGTIGPIMPKGTGLSQEELTKLGVNTPTRTYNLLQDLDFYGNIAQKGAMATGEGAALAQQLARSPDVSRYQALAKIMGQNLVTPRISGEGTLGEAWTSRTGQEQLGSRLAERETQFQNELADQRFLSGWDYEKGIPGGSGMQGALYLAGAIGKGPEILEKGLEGIGTKSYAGNKGGYGWSPSLEEAAKQKVFNQFQNWLNQMGYGGTLGGVVENPNKNLSPVFSGIPFKNT